MRLFEYLLRFSLCAWRTLGFSRFLKINTLQTTHKTSVYTEESSHKSHDMHNLHARFFILLAVLLFFSGCSMSDYQNIVKATLSKNQKEATKQLAKQKVTQYKNDPAKLSSDLKNANLSFDKLLSAFLSEVGKRWGEGEKKSASKKVYVKYTDSYKSRAEVDFERGYVLVETLDSHAPLQSLKKAIITTLLTPENPQGIDLYSASDIELSGRPYLADLVKDNEQKVVIGQWRAKRYAEYLVKNALKSRKAKNGAVVRYVRFPMVRDYENVKSAKYGVLVRKYARANNLSEAMVLAIIKSESSFNPYAVSSVPAYGLMQVVPSSAGRDAYNEIHGKDGVPTRAMLFDPETNIRYGTSYLKILNTRYLGDVKNPQSREYCVIAAYNTGSGNVLRSFDKDKNRAFSKINAKAPSEIYTLLRKNLPYDETRRYLKKVVDSKREFLVYKKS